MVKNLVIIPARRGSKRIKDKNIYSFRGKPLMVWTIQTALESGIFDKVLVSTDSELYAEIAIKYGAWVPFLREEACDDHSTVTDVVSYTLSRLKKQLGLTFDYVASMQPTCPLCTPDIVRETYVDFLHNNSSKTITCFLLPGMHLGWAFKMNQGKADFIFTSPDQTRSQDLPPLYCPTGAVCFQKSQCRSPENIKYHLIPWKYAIDIDSYEDIELAEMIFDLLNKQHNKEY